MSKTIPSTRSPYNVYLEEDGSCILEVIKGNKILYSIDIDGNVNLLGLNMNYLADKEPEIYYLDYLDSKILNKIDILTENYNYHSIINSFNFFINKINNNYSFKEFDMDMAYRFSDYQDSLKQMYELTQEKKYLNISEEFSSFTDLYFFNRNKELSNDDKIFIIEKLNEAILNLKMLITQ